VCVLALALSKSMRAQVNGRTARIPSATPLSQRQWEYTYDITGYEYFSNGVSDGDVLAKIRKHGIEGWELAAIVRETHANKQGQMQYTATLIYKRPK